MLLKKAIPKAVCCSELLLLGAACCLLAESYTRNWLLKMYISNRLLSQITGCLLAGVAAAQVWAGGGVGRSFLKLDAKNPHLKQAKLLLLGAAYCLLAAVAAAKVWGKPDLGLGQQGIRRWKPDSFSFLNSLFHQLEVKGPSGPWLLSPDLNAKKPVSTWLQLAIEIPSNISPDLASLCLHRVIKL